MKEYTVHFVSGAMWNVRATSNWTPGSKELPEGSFGWINQWWIVDRFDIVIGADGTRQSRPRGRCHIQMRNVEAVHEA